MFEINLNWCDLQQLVARIQQWQCWVDFTKSCLLDNARRKSLGRCSRLWVRTVRSWRHVIEVSTSLCRSSWLLTYNLWHSYTHTHILLGPFLQSYSKLGYSWLGRSQEVNSWAELFTGRMPFQLPSRQRQGTEWGQCSWLVTACCHDRSGTL